MLNISLFDRYSLFEINVSVCLMNVYYFYICINPSCIFADSETTIMLFFAINPKLTRLGSLGHHVILMLHHINPIAYDIPAA